MGPVTFVFIVVSGMIAFWLGFRWRAHKGARSTHKTAVATAEAAARAKKTAFKALAFACFMSLIYLFATGYLSLHGLFSGDANATTPSPSPSVHASPAPSARP